MRQEYESLQLYLDEIGKYPLLTREEEIELAKRKELPGEEGETAKEQMICANLRLVVHMAKKYVGQGVALMDLIQEGNMGLMIAADKYDWRVGAKFSSYAAEWIQHKLFRAIANQGRTIRVPAYMQGKLWQIAKKEQEQIQLYGCMPSLEEIAEEMSIDREELVEIYGYVNLPASYEELSEEKNMESKINNSETTDAFADFNARMLKEAINEVVNALPYKEAVVIRCLFGLDGKPPMTLEEVSNLPGFGISKQRIHQIKMAAIRRIYERYGKILQDFLEDS